MLTFEGDEKSELDTKRKGMRSRWSLRSNRFELRTLAGLDANDSGKSHRLSARLQFSAPDSGDPAWENSRQADCEYRQTHVYFLQLATFFVTKKAPVVEVVFFGSNLFWVYLCNRLVLPTPRKRKEETERNDQRGQNGSRAECKET